MAKKRVHEIAKELGFQNRDLIAKLQQLGFEVKSHSSSVNEADVRDALRKADDDRRSRTDEKRLKAGIIRRRPKEGKSGTIIRRRSGSAVEAEIPAEEVATEGATEVLAEAVVEADAQPETVEESATESEGTEVSAEATAEVAEEVKTEAEDKKAVARVVRPDTRKREEEIDEDDEKPDMNMEDLGLSESDFAREDEQAEARVAPPSPARMPVAMQRE